MRDMGDVRIAHHPPGTQVSARGLCRSCRVSRGCLGAKKPLRTDSVNRGLCISFFKLEIISLAISIRVLFFTK
jgi:hypothetical protein